MPSGRFYEMWRIYFENNWELLGDEQHGKHLLYYILDKTLNDGVESIPQERIAADLNISKTKIAELVKRLEAANLLGIAAQHKMASGFKDMIMFHCLQQYFNIAPRVQSRGYRRSLFPPAETGQTSTVNWGI